MKRRQIYMIAVTLILVFSLLAGCTGNGNNKNTAGQEHASSAPPSTADTIASSPEADDGLIPADVQDSSELPDWAGKQLSLKVWFNHGTGGTYAGARKYTDDVVTKEIARVTGVTLDLEHSYDNGGSTTGEVKLGMIAATNDWPDIILGGDQLNTLADNDKIYDLTDLIPKYMPNLMKKIPQSLDTLWNRAWISKGGKVYAVPAGLYNTTLPYLYPDTDVSLFPQANTYSNIWVRDDILKQLYPQAKSQKEIEDLYLKNGKFTREQIFDVPIKSAEDFIQFLYDVQKLHVKEGNKEVAPFYTFSGQDNWALMTGLFSKLDGSYSGSGDNNYFTYWDKETQKVEWMFKQPLFKDLVKQMNVLLRDGVASKEAMVDPYNTFQEKLSGGMYAVTYHQPNNAALEKAGKPYRYRKVYLDIPFNYDKFIFPTVFPDAGTRIHIVKDAVKEEDLPQVLRWLDFLISDAGEKLWYWGPKSAGLFTEQDGMRVYANKEIEDQMVYNQPGDEAQKYGLWLNNGSNDDRSKSGLITYMNKGRFDPQNWYPNKQRNVTEADAYFDFGRVEASKSDDSLTAKMYTFFTQAPEAAEAWKKRTDFENALTKVLAASNDAQFEQQWNTFLSTAEKDGFTDAVRDQVDAAFREANAKYMANITH